MNVKKHSIISTAIYWLRAMGRQEPVILWLMAASILLNVLTPLAGIYLPKLTIDLIQREVTPGRMFLLFALFALLLAAVQGGDMATNNGNYYLINWMRQVFLGELFLKSLRLPYAFTESDKGQAAYQKALNTVMRGDGSGSSVTMRQIQNFTINLLCFFLYSTILSVLSPLVVIALLALSLLNCAIIMKNIRYVESLREEEADISRKYYYTRDAMGSLKTAKDIRIFGMKDWLRGRMDKIHAKRKKYQKKISRKQALMEQLQFFIALVRDVSAYGFLIYQAVEGHIDVGEFVLYFGALTGFSDFVTQMVQSAGALRQAANDTDYYRAYMELSEEELNAGEHHISELSMPPSFEFRDVSFSYGEKKIFDHFNLTIGAGEKLALVGVNGAGKSTLVKLLCGMYEPEEGHILINGIDRKLFPKKEWYSLFSAVFQEYFFYDYLRVWECITLQKKDDIDEKRLWKALEDAGMDTVLKEKGVTGKTWFGKPYFGHGADFSGGQKQKLLLARAIYKNGPMMILDEPTAALDPIAESDIYQSYQKYCKNKTAMFISHRLASTRFSDRIVLLQEGKILETGTHEDLLSSGKEYAKMFAIQASYYKNKKNSAPEEYNSLPEGGEEDAF